VGRRTRKTPPSALVRQAVGVKERKGFNKGCRGGGEENCRFRNTAQGGCTLPTEMLLKKNGYGKGEEGGSTCQEGKSLSKGSGGKKGGGGVHQKGEPEVTPLGFKELDIIAVAVSSDHTLGWERTEETKLSLQVSRGTLPFKVIAGVQSSPASTKDIRQKGRLLGIGELNINKQPPKADERGGDSIRGLEGRIKHLPRLPGGENGP